MLWDITKCQLPKKRIFSESSILDEAIIKACNHCITNSELFPDYITTMNCSVDTDTKAETKVIRFHKWIITAMNINLPSVTSLHICAKEK